MKRSLLILLVIVLLVAAVNVPVAVMLVRPRSGAWPPSKTGFENVIGPQAAMKPLPARPPHDQPWPPAIQWTRDATLGRARIMTWHQSADGQSRFQMQVEKYGWPLPAAEYVEFWWPWDDPVWKTTATHDPGFRLAWAGVLLNPILVGVPLWMLVMSPVVYRWLRARRRDRRGLCPACGYPVGAASVCSECGGVVKAVVANVGGSASA